MRLALDAQPVRRGQAIAWAVVLLVALLVLAPLGVLAADWAGAVSEREARHAEIRQLEERIAALSDELDGRQTTAVDPAMLQRVRDPDGAIAGFEQRIAAFEAGLVEAGARRDDPTLITTGPYGSGARLVSADMAFTGPADLILTALTARDMAHYQVLAFELLTLPGGTPGQVRARLTIGLTLPVEPEE